MDKHISTTFDCLTDKVNGPWEESHDVLKRHVQHTYHLVAKFLKVLPGIRLPQGKMDESQLQPAKCVLYPIVKF
jgi:hypothetical protein